MENYELLDLIGRGAYGKVYLYKRILDKKKVVVKVVPLETISKDDCQATQIEVKVLAMLSHPNIIEYYSSFVELHSVFIVMEYAPGGNLFDYLQSRKNNLMSEEDALYLMSQLVLGMQHMHKMTILHRDLKSHNVFLDRSHRVVKIGDFGISKILSSKSAAHSVVGTPCYLSPELCQERPYNHKSDMWALGCVFYEILTLKRAFESETLPALIQKIMRGVFTPLSSHFSNSVALLMNGLLHTDPSQRLSINQVIAQPVILRHVCRLTLDMGMINVAPSIDRDTVS